MKIMLLYMDLFWIDFCYFVNKKKLFFPFILRKNEHTLGTGLGPKEKNNSDMVAPDMSLREKGSECID